MKSRLLIKKICDEIFRERDNGEVVFDEGSFGESVANDNTVFLSSEGGGLRLVSSSIIEAKSSIVSSVIFSVSSNKGSNSYLGKTADLIIRQTSKLHDYIRDNPDSVKYMLYAPIAMRGMIGAIAGASGGPLTSIGGATSAVLSQQAYSYVIEQALGKKLSELNDYVVNKVANFIRDNFDSSLSNTQAEALSAAIIIGSMSARSIRKDTRAFVNALGRIKTSGVKVDIVRNSAFFFKGSDGSDGDVGGKVGGNRLALGGRSGKVSDFVKGDNIGLDRFLNKSKNGILIDKKTGQYLEPDRGRSSGVGGHGGSYWKLYDKRGNRIGTIDKDGNWLRK